MPVTTRARAAAPNQGCPSLPPPNNHTPNGSSIASKQESDREETKKPTTSTDEQRVIQDFESYQVFVDVEVFMKHVLHVPDNWRQEWADVIREIRRGDSFADAHFAYDAQCKKSGFKEEKFYKPLVGMVNAVFDGLRSFEKAKQKTRLCRLRNDPKETLDGMMSELVPDTVAVREDFFEEISEKEKEEKRSTDTNLPWAHPMQMIELKPGGNLLADGSQMPRLVVNGKDPQEDHAEPYEEDKTPEKNGRPDGGAALVPEGRKRPAEESTQASRKSQKRRPNSTAGGERPTGVPTVETREQKEASLQAGRYFLEQFSVPAFRSHATIGVVDRDRIQFYHANHSVILVSSAISFSTRHPKADVDKFIAIVIAFGLLSLRDSGILHNLQGTKPLVDNKMFSTPKPSRKMRQMQRGHKLVLRSGEDRLELTYGDAISHEPSLSGRDTAVLHATSPDLDGDFVVKIGWPVSGRVPEDEFLRKAIETAKSESRHKWALNHLPYLEFSQSVDFDSDSTHGKVASLFKNAKFANGEYGYEQRTLRIIVQERLYPLKTLTDVKEIAQVLLDVACVHRWLYEVVGIMHRDLSLRNIMYRRTRRGKVYGVLMDFDLSSWTVDLANGSILTSRQKTGTPPFMAYGLLNDSDASHLYRHDMESIFYVMLMLATRYEILGPESEKGEGVWIRQDPGELQFDLWFDRLSYKTLGSLKHSFLLSTREEMVLSPDFDSFRDWLDSIRTSFRGGIRARDVHRDLIRERARRKGRSKKKAVPQFNEETLGGLVHYSALVDPARKLKGKLKGLVVRYRSK